MTNLNAPMYLLESQQRLQKSQGLFSKNAALLTNPHFSASYHCSSLFYPLAHCAAATMNLLYAVKGCVQLLDALFNEPKFAVPATLYGIANHIGAAMISAINACISFVSIFTRTLSTAFNLGYSSTKVNAAFAGQEVGGQSLVGVAGMFAGIGLSLRKNEEDELLQNTLSI